MEKVKNLDAAGPSDPRFMTSLARGLEVLRAFEGREALTVTQAAKATGLPRSSAARCLFTLEQLGYVAADGLAYRLRPALLPLARAYAFSDPLARAGQPIVGALRETLGESCSLGVFESASAPGGVIYICRAETARIISMPLLLGSVLPSYCTAMGRMLLAGLPDAALAAYLATTTFMRRTPQTVTQPAALAVEIQKAQAQGWALVAGELEAGLRSIAVPVQDAKGNVRAALNIGTDMRRRSQAWLLETALPELQAAASHLRRVI